MKSFRAVLPTLQLDDFSSSTKFRKINFIRVLGSSLEKIGFARIKTRNLRVADLKKGYQVARRFFDLNPDKKLEFFEPEAKGLMGYLKIPHRPGYNLVDLEMWVTRRDIQKLQSPSLKNNRKNRWPPGEVEFKSHTTALYKKFSDCALLCLKACALYLGLRENALTNCVKYGDSILRYLHYSLTSDRKKNGVLLNAHQDTTLISLFSAGSAPGLEIKLNEWVPISDDREGILLAGADMLRFLSGGVFKGGAHRVVPPKSSATRRITAIYSSLPRPEVILEPLISSFHGKPTERLIAPMSTSEYLYQVPHPRGASTEE